MRIACISHSALHCHALHRPSVLCVPGPSDAAKPCRTRFLIESFFASDRAPFEPQLGSTGAMGPLFCSTDRAFSWRRRYKEVTRWLQRSQMVSFGATKKSCTNCHTCNDWGTNSYMCIPHMCKNWQVGIISQVLCTST